MTQEKFKDLKELESKIEKIKIKLNVIDSLFKSCGVSCKITGTPRNLSNVKRKYKFYDKELTNEILKSHHKKLTQELKELEDSFEKY
jgi:hypothetical protein